MHLCPRLPPPSPCKGPLRVMGDAAWVPSQVLLAPLYSIWRGIGSRSVEALLSLNEEGLKGYPVPFPLVSPAPGSSGQFSSLWKGRRELHFPLPVPVLSLTLKSWAGRLVTHYFSVPQFPCLENGSKQTLTYLAHDRKGRSQGP